VRRFFMFFMVANLMVSFSAPAKESLADPNSISVAFEDQDAGISFPATLGRLIFEGKQEYDQPEWGYSLRYDGDELNLMKADVYLYDNGVAVPDGAGSGEVIYEFENVLAALSGFEKIGRYKDVKEISRGNEKFKAKDGSGREFLWARYTYSQISDEDSTYAGERTSDTYLLGFKGRFVKVRITWRSGAASAEDDAREFIEALSKLF